MTKGTLQNFSVKLDELNNLSNRYINIGDRGIDLSAQLGKLIIDEEFLKSLLASPLTGVPLEGSFACLIKDVLINFAKLKSISTFLSLSSRYYEIVINAWILGVDSVEQSTTLSSILFAGYLGFSNFARVKDDGDWRLTFAKSFAYLPENQYQNAVKLMQSWEISNGTKYESEIVPLSLTPTIFQNTQITLFNKLPQNVYGINNEEFLSFEKYLDSYQFSFNVAYVESLNDQGKCLIQTQVHEGDPPTISVVLPSTKGDSDGPNSWYQNYRAILGESDIAEKLDQILEQEIKSRGLDISKTNIIISGFSQGGLTAGLFAQNYASKYQVSQIITFGAPIGRYKIPSNTKAISLEFEDDEVTYMDGKENPKNINTIKVKDGQNSTKDGYYKDENGNEAHNMLKYTDAVKENQEKIEELLDQGLKNSVSSTKYYQLDLK